MKIINTSFKMPKFLTKLSMHMNYKSNDSRLHFIWHCSFCQDFLVFDLHASCYGMSIIFVSTVLIRVVHLYFDNDSVFLHRAFSYTIWECCLITWSRRYVFGCTLWQLYNKGAVPLPDRSDQEILEKLEVTRIYIFII